MGSHSDRAPLGIVVVGTGQVGRVHVECARRAGANVLGVVGSSPDRADAKARSWGVPRTFRDLDEALADPNVHVVHVATPNDVHAQQAIAAARAGKHVICEKPLAMNSGEASAMLDVAQSFAITNATCFEFRFYPLMHEARAMIERGDIGHPLFVSGSYHQDWLLRETDWNWRLESERAGNLRAVSDIGSHWLDLVCWITGTRVHEVFADLHTFLPTRYKPAGEVETFSGRAVVDGTPVRIVTDDAAAVLLRLSHDVRGAFTVSQVSAGRKNDLRFEIAGTEASLMWSSENSDTLWIGHRARTNEVLLKDPVHLDPRAAGVTFYPGGHVEGYGEAFTSLFSTVYSDILGAAHPPGSYPTFEDGLRSVQVSDAVWKSAARGAWVTVA